MQQLESMEAKMDGNYWKGSQGSAFLHVYTRADSRFKRRWTMENLIGGGRDRVDRRD